VEMVLGNITNTVLVEDLQDQIDAERALTSSLLILIIADLTLSLIFGAIKLATLTVMTLTTR
jgi:hypothetical protein